MSHKNVNPVIVIPVYKDLSDWTTNELISLKACLKVLYKYPIYLVGPRLLDWDSILNWIFNEYKKNVQLGIFENDFFNNIDGYNRLLKSLVFFEYFSSYSHILIYQLDAYVFKDELSYWCKKGYDFIGAPWLDGYFDNTSTNFIGVGNGGFSLHKTFTSIKTLKKVRAILSILERCENTYLYKRVQLLKWITRYILLNLIFNIKNQKYILGLSLKDKIYEDKFWGRFIPVTFSDFKVADVSDALKFSFEVNPKYLYKLNNKNLPFGCHAWEKYDPDFWRPFINDKIMLSDLKLQ
jgi:hypothetical protein